MELLPLLLFFLRSFTFIFIIFFSLLIFPFSHSDLLIPDLFVGLSIIDDSIIIRFLEQTRVILELNGHVRSQLRNLEVLHFFVAHNLLHKNVLWDTLSSLVHNDWVSLRGDIVFEEIVSDSFLLQNNLILHDLLVPLTRMQNRYLGPGSCNQMCGIIVVLKQPLLYAFYWFVYYSNVASCGSGEILDVVDQIRQVVVQII